MAPPSPLRRARLQRAAFRYLERAPTLGGVLEAPPTPGERLEAVLESRVRLRTGIEEIPISREPREVRLRRAMLRSLIEAPAGLGEVRPTARLPTLEEMAREPIRLRPSEEIPSAEASRRERLRRAALKLREPGQGSEQKGGEEEHQA